MDIQKEIVRNGRRYGFYKEKPSDKIWQVYPFGMLGELLISFDGEAILNLWTDYPHNFTQEQKELFDKENPYWADFFRNRM